MSTNKSSSSIHLLDLPWEDVLVPHILSYLPLRHIITLQRVSKAFQSLVQLYLANCRSFDSTQPPGTRHTSQAAAGPACLHRTISSPKSKMGVPETCSIEKNQLWKDTCELKVLLGSQLPKNAFCSMLKHNSVLQRLDLRSCSDWLTDKELLPIIGQNHHLLHINLNSCVQLSRQSLVAISISCPHLQKICLGHCEWVDCLSLRSLADHCKHLEAVDLTACRQLKDDAICYLVQKSKRMKCLSLAVNANISDVAVEETAKNCRDLEHLDLTGCLRVKNESIRTLAEYCTKLKSLKVKHCHNVTESSLGILRKRDVTLDVEPPLQRALVLLQDVVGFAPFINLQI